jgi:hypothetical protein
MSAHVNTIITACGQTLYALRTMRFHGMANRTLQVVFRSVALAKLLYASVAWFGFTNAHDRDRLEAFMRKSVRAGFFPKGGDTFAELCEIADERLFRQVCSNNTHILHHLLPPKKLMTYNLRKRAHDYELDPKSTQLADSNFLARMLYKDTY